jgi:N utilization substance protein A
VLAVKKEDIVRRTELEEETVDDVYRVIRQEFADDEDLPTDEATAQSAPVQAENTDSAPAAQ